jgi:photosystem II stability/assembly factor-like uncharacterized protein
MGRTFLAGVLACAALVAASRADAAAFEPEAVVRRVDRVAFLALVRAGERLVAAGERGRILVSDDSGSTWRVSTTPTFHTLTSLFFADARIGFATGHQGVLLRTEDGGSTWKQALIEMKEKPALFAVRVDGAKGIAVGAYGAYLESADAGRTWAARRIGPADFDKHLTGIAHSGAGRIVLAGEAGTLLATADGGATWQEMKSPYAGSWFGALGLQGGAVVAYGMRGNAWRSSDGGKSWQRVDLGKYTGALQGAVELPDASVVLSGADGMIARSTDGGATFVAAPLPSRITVTATARATSGRWLVAGPAGLRVAD